MIDRIKTRRFRRAALFFVCLLFALSARSHAESEQDARRPSERGSVSEIHLALSRTSDAAAKERLYLRLIEEFPETDDAEEAHWALSALYLDGFDEPKEEKAQEILGQFLARYPSSLWASHVESRLLWLRGEEKSLF